MELKDLIRNTRLKKKLTQKQLADAVSTHPQNISNIERGETIGPDLCIKISDVLEIKRKVILSHFLKQKIAYYKKFFGV